jgi:hypothetical protein
MTAETVKDKAALYKPNVVTRWQQQPTRGRTTRRFVGQNPPPGAQVYYSLPKRAEKVALEVFDINGASVSKLEASGSAGLHRLTWDLTAGAARPAGEDAPRGFGQRGQRGGGGQRAAGQRGGQAGAEAEAGQPGEAGPRGGGGGGGFGFGQGLRRQVPAGTYRVVLTVDGQTFTQTLVVEGDPNATGRLMAGEEDEDDDGD